MQTTVPNLNEVAEFIAFVFRAMKKEGESVLERFQKEEPLLYVLAGAQLQVTSDGPEEFLDGLKRMVK